MKTLSELFTIPTTQPEFVTVFEKSITIKLDALQNNPDELWKYFLFTTYSLYTKHAEEHQAFLKPMRESLLKSDEFSETVKRLVYKGLTNPVTSYSMSELGNIILLLVESKSLGEQIVLLSPFSLDVTRKPYSNHGYDYINRRKIVLGARPSTSNDMPTYQFDPANICALTRSVCQNLANDPIWNTSTTQSKNTILSILSVISIGNIMAYT